MRGKAIYLTAREISAVRDVLQSITAYTAEEAVEHFDWTDEDAESWSTALGKFTVAARVAAS